MRSIAITLQRTYLTKNCKKKHCATSSYFVHWSILMRENNKKNRQKISSISGKELISDIYGHI